MSTAQVLNLFLGSPVSPKSNWPCDHCLCSYLNLGASVVGFFLMSGVLQRAPSHPKERLLVWALQMGRLIRVQLQGHGGILAWLTLPCPCPLGWYPPAEHGSSLWSQLSHLVSGTP